MDRKLKCDNLLRRNFKRGGGGGRGNKDWEDCLFERDYGCRCVCFWADSLSSTQSCCNNRCTTWSSKSVFQAFKWARCGSSAPRCAAPPSSTSERSYISSHSFSLSLRNSLLPCPRSWTKFPSLEEHSHARTGHTYAGEKTRLKKNWKKIKKLKKSSSVFFLSCLPRLSKHFVTKPSPF